MNLKEFWHPYIGALSITFDDSAESQLQKAIPAMNTYGIRGSFYLSLFNDTGQKEIQPWKEVAALGHEICNHTLSHFCSNNLCYNLFESNQLVETQIGLESRSIIDIEEDILAAEGLWVILIFHEIDGKRLSVCSSDFELLLDYLKRNAERIWTAPVVEIAQKIANFQETQCTVLGE